jgi:replicative superfamily II helicase
MKVCFAMATGTGKTLTALNCLLNEAGNGNILQSNCFGPYFRVSRQWKRNVSEI